MTKITIQHGKLLEPFFNFYVQNSSDVKGSGWKEWVPPDKEEIEKRIKAYKDIWTKYEERILNGICSALDLSFDEEDIDVYIVAGVNRSMSNPIIIKSGYSPESFIVALSHELSHRIFKGKDFKFDKILLNKTNNKNINDHILVYSVLRKIFENEPKMIKIIADIKYNEDYKKAYKLSEQYEDILKFFRDKK
jgi:hypothetical protein